MTTYGFHVAAIDTPGHGDRPRNHRTNSGSPNPPGQSGKAADRSRIVVDYSTSLAERAVPEWQATIDALQALPEIGAEARSATAACHWAS